MAEFAFARLELRYLKYEEFVGNSSSLHSSPTFHD